LARRETPTASPIASTTNGSRMMIQPVVLTSTACCVAADRAGEQAEPAHQQVLAPDHADEAERRCDDGRHGLVSSRVSRKNLMIAGRPAPAPG
jgi:hypothetical protein